MKLLLSTSFGKEVPTYDQFEFYDFNVNLGDKKASTKKKPYNSDTGSVNIDDKFLINTVIEVNKDGGPTKKKMVRENIYLILLL